MSSGPRAAEGAIICGEGAAPYGWYMDRPGGGKPSARLGSYWRAGLRGRWFLLSSLRTRRLAILTDRLGWRGGLFLEWASAAFEDGEWRGRGELLEDNSLSTGRSISFGATVSLPLQGKERGKGRGGSRDWLARLTSNWVRGRSFSSRNWFHLYAQFGHLSGLLLLSRFQFLAP